MITFLVLYTFSPSKSSNARHPEMASRLVGWIYTWEEYTIMDTRWIKSFKFNQLQECIPVWCIPPAAVAATGVLHTPLGADPHPPVAGTPSPGCRPGDLPGQIPLNFPLGCGPGDPPARFPSTSPLSVGLETPWPDPPQLPHGCGPGDPQARSPSTSTLGVGLETPQARSPQPSHWLWAWRPPWPDPLQFPPWLWAWRPPLAWRPSARSPSISPLGLDTTLTPRPATRHAGIPPAMHAGIARPRGQTDTCKT